MPGILQFFQGATVLEWLYLCDLGVGRGVPGGATQPGLDWRRYLAPYATRPAEDAANPPVDDAPGFPAGPAGEWWLDEPVVSPPVDPALPGLWKLPAGATAVWDWAGPFAPGRYAIALGWSADPYLSTAAAYTVETGDATYGPITLNQRAAPAGATGVDPSGAAVVLGDLWNGALKGGAVRLTLTAPAAQDGPPEAGPARLKLLGDPAPTPGPSPTDPPPAPAPGPPPPPVTAGDWYLPGTDTPAGLALARLNALGLAGARAELNVDDMTAAALILWGRDQGAS